MIIMLDHSEVIRSPLKWSLYYILFIIIVVTEYLD
jgi:hypothetical protein